MCSESSGQPSFNLRPQSCPVILLRLSPDISIVVERPVLVLCKLAQVFLYAQVLHTFFVLYAMDILV